MEFIARIQQAMTRLEKRREELLGQLSELNAELQEFETALRVASKLESSDGTLFDENRTPTSMVASDADHDTLDQFSGSRRDLITKLLEEAYPKGLLAHQFRTAASNRFGFELKPTTLTVTLGRLKKERIARIDRRVWYHVPPEQRTGSTTNLVENEDAPPSKEGEASH